MHDVKRSPIPIQPAPATAPAPASAPPPAAQARGRARPTLKGRLPTEAARARLVPSALSFAAERPDAQFPFVLITGRQLEHWHTGSMTRIAAVLDALEPEPTVSLHPLTLARLGVQAGQRLRVSSRRGRIELMARADEATPADTVFIPFSYAEAAANLLTNPALDPVAKIAKVKYCAVAVEPAPV